MAMNEIVRDGGMKSRKLWFAVFAMMLVVISGAGAVYLPTFASIYETLVGGIVAVAGMYLTGNVAQKWVGVRAQPALMAAAAALPQPPAVPLADQPAAEDPGCPPEPRFTE